MENEKNDILLTIPLIAKENSDNRFLKIIKWLVIMLIISNIMWATAWAVYILAPQTSQIVELESNDSGNANYIDGQGDIINGEH